MFYKGKTLKAIKKKKFYKCDVKFTRMDDK